MVDEDVKPNISETGCVLADTSWEVTRSALVSKAGPLERILSRVEKSAVGNLRNLAVHLTRGPQLSAMTCLKSFRSFRRIFCALNRLCANTFHGFIAFCGQIVHRFTRFRT